MAGDRDDDHLIEAIKWVIREELEKIAIREEKSRADLLIEIRQMRDLLEKLSRNGRPQTLQAFFAQNPVLGLILAAFIMFSMFLANASGIDITRLWR